MSPEKLPFATHLASLEAPILADGAMGTMIHSRGVGFDRCFDELNLTEPGLIAEIHREYIDAGAQLIMTNTFGANRYRLAKHGLADKVSEINRAGVELARRVILASFRPVWLAGDVGPLGVRLVPFGRVQLEQAQAAFREQITVLVEAGVELIVCETFSDLYEIREAVIAARAVTGLPVVASMSFTRDDRTLLGNAPEEVACMLHEAGADLLGVNCSGGPAQILRILRKMRVAVPEAHFSVMPNAGLPEQVEGRIMYPAAPHYFGEYAQAFRQEGACLIGGCCGTTAEHIAAMRTALDAPAKEFPLGDDSLTNGDLGDRLAESYQPTRLASRLRSGTFVFAVEMAPPRGFATQKLLAAASLLSEAGADVIDVADSPMARMRMSPWAVCSLIQEKVGIETALHFPTRGRNLLRVQGDLLAAHALNVRNVFVVMGDPTAIGDYPDAMDNYDVVPSGLIKLIKQGFNAGLDYAGSDIGQPTSFFVSGALNLTPRNVARELKVMRRKINAGADYFLTQPVNNPVAAREFIGRARDELGDFSPFILAGILPVFSLRHAAFLHNEVPGIAVPDETFARIEAAGPDAPQEGVRIALEVIEQIRPVVNGIYIIPPFGRFDIAAEIIEAVQ